MEKLEMDAFIMKHGCNPHFWLDALESAIYTTDCKAKEKVLQNSHDKLKMFIEFITIGKEP